MNVKIHREPIERNRLRNEFIDSKSEADRISYSKERNYNVSLISKEKNTYFSNIKIYHHVRNNKNFWKNVKPPYSEKVDLQVLS